MITEPLDIPVGRLAVVADPFDNVLVLIDLSKGRYATDETGSVTGVVDAPANSALTETFGAGPHAHGPGQDEWDGG